MTDLEMELRFERIEKHLLRLTDATTDFVSASDARMTRIEQAMERVARDMGRLQQNMEQVQRNLDALIRAIIADRSNGKGTK